jgi:arylsulfatase A-like enzyme
MLDRRTLLKLAGGLSVLSATPADSAHRVHKTGGASLPNFIHICADDVRLPDMKNMPNVRGLMRDVGVNFTKHFTPYTLCAPSRVGILTGLQPHNHGVLTDNKDGGYAGYQPLEGNSLPVWLTNAGYHVGHIGKFINNYNKIAPDHVPPGYADWRTMSVPFSKYTNFTLNENGTQVNYDSGEYTTDVFVQKVLTFLATAPQPFALFFWPNCCHWPSIPAAQDVGTFANVDMPLRPSFNEADVSDKPKYIQKLPLFTKKQIAKIQDKWRTRQECLQALDRGMATIINTLETSGLMANTHVMFTADNGFIEGEHRIQNAKNVLYEEGSNVPFFYREPSGYIAQCRQPVSNIDATATMVALSGATAGRVLDGSSLSPLLADVNASWNSATLMQSRRTSGIATANYRYYEWPRSNEFELYDMTVDEFQLNNVAGHSDYQAIQASCAASLQQLQGCGGDTCSWTQSFPPPPKSA